jgi:hypothetical protein
VKDYIHAKYSRTEQSPGQIGLANYIVTNKTIDTAIITEKSDAITTLPAKVSTSVPYILNHQNHDAVLTI